LPVRVEYGLVGWVAVKRMHLEDSNQRIYDDVRWDTGSTQYGRCYSPCSTAGATHHEVRQVLHTM
jgi:hypothetical protein